MSTRSSAEHRATYQSHNDDDDSAQLEHTVEDKMDHKTQHRVEVYGARAGRACQIPARIWLRRAEEAADQPLRTLALGHPARPDGVHCS